MTLAFLVGVVIFVWAVAFAIAWVHYHNKARKNSRLTGQPIDHGHIIKNACGIACVVGLICCVAETKAEAAANNNSGGEGGGGNGDVEAQPVMSQPMPSYQPQGMDWTPVNSAAQDAVQG